MLDGGKVPREALTLVLLCLGSFMIMLDNSIVNVALPVIGRDLDLAPSSLQWVLTAYALPFGGFLLLGGRLGDLLGRRRVYVAGLAVFALASLAGGLAPTPEVLVGARAVQGLGAAALSPSALALLIAIFPAGPQRHRALGIHAGMGSLGVTVGMLAGGLLTHLAGWRWVMLINVPIALGVLLPTLAVIPAPGRAARRPRLDLAGAATITLGLTALLYGAEQASQVGWAAPASLTPLTIAVVLLCGFVAIQRRARAPLLPPAFFGARTVRVANLAMLLKSTVGLAGLFIPTLYFQQVLGYSPLASGLAFLPSGLAALAAGLTGRRLIGRLGGPRPVILLGLGSQLAGLLLMTAMPTDGGWTLLLLGLLAVGAGFLWADVGLTISATADLTEHFRGLGAGVLRTAGQLGGALGLGVIAAIITARAHADGDPAGTPDALVAGLQAGLWCGAALAAAALLLVLSGLPKHWPLRDPSTDLA